MSPRGQEASVAHGISQSFKRRLRISFRPLVLPFDTYEFKRLISTATAGGATACCENIAANCLLLTRSC